MPRLDDPTLQCVFYLYRNREAAEHGSAFGGTGFLIGLHNPANPTQYYFYAISNRHVVHRDAASVIRLNQRDGLVDIMETEPTDWIESTAHDLAATPIPIDVERHSIGFVPTQIFLTKDVVDRGVIGPGDDTFMIGRFVNHDGRLVNRPSVSFGHLSMMPDGITHPVYRRAEESFAVEMRSMSGYSGSPVFVLPAQFDLRNHSHAAFRGLFLLGVNWGYIVTNADVRERAEAIRTASAESLHRNVQYVPINTGMNGVVPAWHLYDLLHHPKLREHRRSLGAVF